MLIDPKELSGFVPLDPTRPVDVNGTLRDIEAAYYESSLYEFLKAGWRYIDPNPYVDSWHLGAIAEHLEAVKDGEITRLIINQPPRTSKSSMLVAFDPWVWAQADISDTSGPGVQFLHASYAQNLSIRDSVKTRRLIESPWYQRYWGDRVRITSDQNTKVRFDNSAGGYRLATSVGGTLTGEGGHVLIVDDPENAVDMQSEAVRLTTLEWFDNSLSTRLNNPRTGAIILVMQRLHESDLTGHILSSDAGQDWVHLMLPMRYEADRASVLYPNAIGWSDPRTEEGELLTPERYDETSVARLERQLGPFQCNPGEAPVLMADLSMKPISAVRPGDEIVGFTTGELKEGAAHARQHLTPAVVKNVFSRQASVVKMYLDSGEVIRCTPDHRWYRGKRRIDRSPDKLYGPAKIGSKLSRICPPNLLKLTPEEERMAGWLSGFYDGEGTVSLSKRLNGHKASAAISFYQGAGRNLPLCEKLENILEHFKFNYTVQEDWRKDPNGDYGYRCYRLRSSDGLQTLQKFLHIAKPTKWRDRIIEGAMRGRFIVGRERVVRIEPDGEEMVYALETTTGNYVVWGLASSNSAGQLQQRPEPKGGGILKRDYWKDWESENYPSVSYVLASIDTAYTTKEENDYSAMTVWGIFEDDNEVPRVMLMNAWRAKLEFHELVEKIAGTARKFKVDQMLIENKAAGVSVAQEIRRVYGYEDWGVQLVDPKGQDKVARAYAVQHLFADELVYAPTNFSWADMVITECASFPKGKNDDLTDTVTQALRFMRTTGMLTRGSERTAELSDSLTFKSNSGDKPLYPI